MKCMYEQAKELGPNFEIWYEIDSRPYNNAGLANSTILIKTWRGSRLFRALLLELWLDSDMFFDPLLGNLALPTDTPSTSKDSQESCQKLP